MAVLVGVLLGVEAAVEVFVVVPAVGHRGCHDGDAAWTIPPKVSASLLGGLSGLLGGQKVVSHLPSTRTSKSNHHTYHS